MSISTILPPLTVKPRTENGRARVLGAEHHARVEHGEQGVEVAVAGGGQEGVDHHPLAGEVGVGDRGRVPHPAAGAAGQLEGRRHRSG